MSILMVLDHEFPHDERVEKEACSLIKEGFEVHLLCLNHRNQKSYENYKGIYIHRIALSSWLKNKLYPLYLIFPLYKIIWAHNIKKILNKISIHAIHIHDLPLTDVGYKFKKRNNLFLVCDQHEYFSNWIKHTFHMNTPVGKIIKYLSNWENYEKKYLRKADCVLTVEEPLRKLYIEKVKVNADRVIKVPNTPLRSMIENIELDRQSTDYSNDFVIFYGGGITPIRGIDIMLKALPIVKHTIPKIKFVLAGKIHKGFDPLKYAKYLGVEHYVDYLGHLSIAEYYKYMSLSDICIHLPPVKRLETDLTIATKIYQYVAMEKPIIVSQAKLMKDFVEREGLGFSVSDNDSQDLAGKIIDLYNNPDLMNKFAQNARRIKKDIYWENTVTPLINFYKECAER